MTREGKKSLALSEGRMDLLLHGQLPGKMMQEYGPELYARRGPRALQSAGVEVACMRARMWDNQLLKWWSAQNMLLLVKWGELERFAVVRGLIGRHRDRAWLSFVL